MSWTAERVEHLKSLWLSGSSAAEIAKELGNTTRSGVLGKINRLGLCDEDRPPRPELNGRHKSPGHHVLTQRTRSIERPKFPKIPELRVVKAEETEMLREGPVISLLDLTSKGCRWPMGTPGQPTFGFCGADRAHPEKPYCDRHAARAYVSAKKPISLPRGVFLPGSRRSVA